MLVLGAKRARPSYGALLMAVGPSGLRERLLGFRAKKAGNISKDVQISSNK